MFSERAKTIALAIVKIFETSKPFGDYSAVAVLDDGAGISYGTSQFTHKSGSLYDVLERFEELGGILPAVVQSALPDFEGGINILKRSNDKALRVILAKLGKDEIMQQAQREIAFENYLRPALAACEGSNFGLPLSLAVVYDSMNHGSWAKIRDRVQLELPASIKPEQYEREWITAYVRERHAWLNSIPRLKKTAYRTQFFLDQIKRHNWNLTLPLTVHGFKLTEDILFPAGEPQDSAAAPPKPADRPDPVIEKESSQTTAADDIEPAEPGGEFTEGERPDPAPQVHADNVASMIVPPPVALPKPSPQSEPVTVKKERSSIWARMGAGVAILMGMGINVGNFVNNKLNEMTLPQLGYVLGGVAIIAVGLWVYDRSAQRAHEKTQRKMQFANETDTNTVELN